MVMDKGLGLRQAEDLCETTGHLIDFVKLGFGTSVVCRQVKEKVRMYQSQGIGVFVGGTLFEAFLVREQLDEYIRYIDDLGCDAMEISDGSILLPHEEKCRLIGRFASTYTVLSEVGAKDATVEADPATWARSMSLELRAGSSFVIGEARESGNVGLYRKDGQADDSLVRGIMAAVAREKVIWEAPLKHQQLWFVRLLGTNVNLGNIDPAEVAALETLRLGLRGDTFFDFLPEAFASRKLKG